MASRSNRRVIAEETVRMVEQGGYTAGGKEIDFSEAQSTAENATRILTPEDIAGLRSRRIHLGREHGKQTAIEVVEETTFGACRRLLSSGAPEVVCLNFASAKNPGGGFLNGSQAQEECLSRASGLYACLLQQPRYYEINRRCGTCLYTHHLIDSPDVPVFRDDDDQLLESWVPVSIITSPAVNAGAVRKNEPANASKIPEVMRERIEMVLNVAANNGHRNLVLGAWGCGVFQNDPVEMAGWFHEWLVEADAFAGLFDRVVFAVYSRDKRFIEAFEKVFGS